MYFLIVFVAVTQTVFVYGRNNTPQPFQDKPACEAKLAEELPDLKKGIKDPFEAKCVTLEELQKVLQ